MTMILLALAIATQATQTAPTAPPVVTPAPAPAPVARGLRDLPGVVITYHDLTEKDVKNITKAIIKKKSLTPEQLKLVSASSRWGVSPTMMKLTKGETCTITKAKAEFTASVDLPRFDEAWISAADLPAWRQYLSTMESQVAAKLWYPYQRLSLFEQAVVGKPCDQALKDGAAVLERIKAEAAAFQPPAPPPAPAAAPAASPTAKVKNDRASEPAQPIPDVGQSRSGRSYLR